MINRKLALLGATAACLTMMSAAMAADSGWYVNASIGQSTAALDKSNYDAAFLTLARTEGALIGSGLDSSSLNKKDLSVGFHVGYQLNRYFGLESGVVILGSANYNGYGRVDPAPPLTSSMTKTGYSVDADSKGLTLGGVATLPLGRVFDLHAKGGTYFARTTVRTAWTIQDITGSGIRTAQQTLPRISSTSARTTETLFGAGAAAHLGANWQLGLDWTRYNKVGNVNTTGEATIDDMSLTVSYHF